MEIPTPTLVPSVPEPVTPSEPAPTPAPEPAPTGGEPTAAPADATLYELPDGRKVDGETLAREWKENFMPDYTQKSQKLSQYETINNPPQDNVPEWKKPDYVPKSYDEIIERGAELALTRLQEKAQQEETHRTQVAQQVDASLAEIRKNDPKLDENALFLHANKYGFRDLTNAYQNMKQMKQIELDTEARVVKNLKGRDNPVGVPSGGTSPTGQAPLDYRTAGSALEYFQRLKGN